MTVADFARQRIWGSDVLRGLLLLLGIVLLVYVPVSLLGRTLQAPLYYPLGVVQEGAYGYEGRLPVNIFDIDLATPAYYEWPINKLVGEAYRSGELPLWNPYQAAGTPLAAQYSSRAFFPYQVLLDVMPVATWDFFFLGRLWLAGFFTFLFLRRLRVSWLSAVLGGSLYMLSGTFVWFINLEQMVNVAMMAPALLWAIEGLWNWRWRRGVAGMAAVVGLVLVAGQPEVALFVLVLGAAYTLFRILNTTPPERKLKALGAVSAGALGLLLAAPLLLPFLEFQGASHNIHPPGGTMGVVGPASPLDAISILVPSFYERLTFFRFFPDNGRWDWLGGYLGVVAIYLALLGAVLVTIQKESKWRGSLLFFLGFGLIVVLKNFGFPPVAWVGRLPLLDQAWSPRWAGPVWTLSFAVAAALGLEALRDQAQGAAIQRGVARQWDRYGRPPWQAFSRFWRRPMWVVGVAAALTLSAIPLFAWASRRVSESSGLLGEVAGSQYFTTSVVLGIFVALIILATAVFLTWTSLQGRFPVGAFLVLALLELWFAIPWGYDVTTVKLTFIPLAAGMIAVMALTERHWLAAVSALTVAVVVFTGIDATAERGLPQRFDPSTPAPYVSFLKQQDGFYRVMGIDGVLMPNFASALGLQDIHFINALTNAAFHEFKDTHLQSEPLWPFQSSVLWFTGNPQTDVNRLGKAARVNLDIGSEIIAKLPFYSLLGVKYIVTPPGYELTPAPENRLGDSVGDGSPSTASFPLVYDAEVRVFENSSVLPRAFMVYETVTVPSYERAQEEIQGSGFDPAQQVVLETPSQVLQQTVGESPQLAMAPSNAASITHYGLNNVTIEVEATQPGVLFLSDVYDPGWTASVDGRSTEVLKANGAFRAVVLEQGKHTVVFRYFPQSFANGLTLAFFAALVVAILGVASQRNWRRLRRAGALGWQVLGDLWQTSTGFIKNVRS